EALQAFKDYKAEVENNSSGKRIQTFSTNNSTEYVNNDFEITLHEFGIKHSRTAPYTKELNGLIERPNRTLLEKVRSLIYQANLPRYLWGEALKAAVYLYNRTPHSSLPGYISLHEAVTGNRPIYDNVKVWGSLCYYRDNLPKKKLDQRGYKAALIGFGKEANIFKVWDLTRYKAVWTKDVKIFEGIFLVPVKETGQIKDFSEDIIIVDDKDLAEKSIQDQKSWEDFSELRKAVKNASKR